MSRTSSGARDRAKREAEAEARVRVVPIEVTLPTKRKVLLSVPADVSDSEWLALVGMVPKIRDNLRASLTDPAKPKLLTPGELEAPRQLRPS